MKTSQYHPHGKMIKYASQFQRESTSLIECELDSLDLTRIDVDRFSLRVDSDLSTVNAGSVYIDRYAV